MFIDYITLMLINMVAGLVLLADFVYRGLDGANPKRWIPGFGLVGAIALVTGLHMTLTWPVPGSFNISFGCGSFQVKDCNESGRFWRSFWYVIGERAVSR